VLDFPNPGVISGYLSQTGSCSMYMSEYRSRWGEGVLYKFSKSKSLNKWFFIKNGGEDLSILFFLSIPQPFNRSLKILKQKCKTYVRQI